MSKILRTFSYAQHFATEWCFSAAAADMILLTMISQDLVTHMTQKDPSRRLTADQYLSRQRDKAFPAYFYTFLGLYCQRFAQVPIIHNDDRVARCPFHLVLNVMLLMSLLMSITSVLCTAE